MSSNSIKSTTGIVIKVKRLMLLAGNAFCYVVNCDVGIEGVVICYNHKTTLEQTRDHHTMMLERLFVL